MFVVKDERVFRLPAATGLDFNSQADAQGRRQDPKTPVQQALMRGLITALPVFRLGAASI
jgi:hypothetical protein